MVYANDTKNAEKVKDTLSKHSDSLLLIQADITKAPDRERILIKTLEHFNTVDVLINNAGVASKAGFLKETESAYNETELFKKMVSNTPLKRAAEADDQSSYTTGTDILVDGGYLALLPGRTK